MAASMKSVCCNIITKQLSSIKPGCKLPKRSYSSTQTSCLSSYSNRSHTCGELNLNNIGQEVTLCGWIQYQRYGKFLLLRDWHGLTQVTVSNIEDESIHKMSFESILEVKGQVQARPQGQENKKMSTGDIEVVIKEMKILNPCRLQLPFEIKDFYKVKEQLRMKYRYLDLRQKIMQKNLRLRSQIIMKMREFLSNEHSFVDVETPTLFRKTPGGAQEFIVPSQIEGEFYSLPQSPQQFKQLLMVGGIDRYYQIAKCYRDEGAKPDRQPEFTQVDIEMSFVNQDNIMKLVEDLLTSCWPFKQLTTPFPQYTYNQVMSTYGVDKPDTRFDIQIQDVTEILNGRIEIFKNLQSQNKTIQIISIPKAASLLSNTEIQKIIKSCCDVTYHLPVLPLKYTMDKIWSPNITNLLNEEDLHQIQQTCDIQPDEVMFLTSGTDFQPHTVLGKIRLKMAELLESKGIKVRDAEQFNFLWVIDFPLFLPKEDGTGDIESAHHPFTAPGLKDIELIYTDPLQVKGQHYDLVLNGNEIGGGSIRNHQAELQKYILQHILKEDTTQLSHLLEALDAGCPPHGGIALGLDRLMAIVCNASSIRDVIAFPKSSDGRDLMSGAPSKISHEELDLYHIQIKEN